MRRLLLQVVFVATLFGELGRAGPEEDFANNLFSDLGPLLALFGERVTMQFMSEAMGWADSVILAMAPIGILTIIVAAIRVSGPLWLKALIGRARENVSVAEMELMSSTSEEVCELYNGQSIVRCQGKPEIWEFILLFKKCNERASDMPPKIEFKTLSEAVRDGSIVDAKERADWKKFWRNVLAIFGLNPKRPSSDTEAARNAKIRWNPKKPHQWDLTVIRDITPAAPNIALNGHSQFSRVQVHATACFATLVQAGLLIFFGIITYHPDIKQNYLKDSQPVGKSAFPLVASGTALLVLGLLVCAHVVEDSTTEHRYELSDECILAQMIWVQRGQTVGDQVFKPYATLPRSWRTIITTSRRRVRQRKSDSFAFAQSGSMTNPDNTTDEAATAPSVAGNDASSSKEAVNAFATTQESVPNKHSKFAAKRNLTMIRTWMVEHGAEVKTVTGVGLSLTGFVVQFVGLRNMSWAASIAQLSGVLILVGVRAWVRRGISQPLSHQQLTPKFELEWLTLVLNILKINPGSCFDILRKDLLRKRTAEHRGEPQHLLDDIYPMPWGVNTDLNQDYWPLIPERDMDQALGGRHWSANSEFNHPNKTNETWTRDTGPESPQGLRLLGPGRAIPRYQLMQDLQWWVPSDLDEIVDVRRISGSDEIKTADAEADVSTVKVSSSQESGCSLYCTIDGIKCHSYGNEWTYQRRKVRMDSSRRKLGLPGTDLLANHDSAMQNFATILGDDSRWMDASTHLAVESHDDIELTYAKTLLWLFLRSVAKTLCRPVAGQVETRTTREGYLLLWHKDIAELAERIQQNGLGTPLEAYLSIVCPLSMEEKLPFPQPIFDLALSEASKIRKRDGILEAGVPYSWLWQQCQFFCESQRGIYARGVACLLEYLKDVYTQQQAYAPVTHSIDAPSLILQRQQDTIIGVLVREHNLGSRILSQLLMLYNNRRHPWPEGLHWIHTASCSDSIAPWEWTKELGVCDLRRLEIEGSVSRGWFRQGQLAEFPDSRDAAGWTPVHYLAATGFESDYAYDDYAGEKDLRGWTPLHYACWYGHDAVVRQLLSRRETDSWCQGFDGATPFHCAVRNENVKVLAELLQQQKQQMNGPRGLRRRGLGQDIGVHAGHTSMNCLPQSVQDHEGRAPIHWAVLAGNLEAVEKLIDDREIKDDGGNAALHLAALEGRRRIANVLVGAGADVKAKNRSGQTPLHSVTLRLARQNALRTRTVTTECGDAIVEGSVDILAVFRALSDKLLLPWSTEDECNELVKLLIEAGADVAAEDTFKMTALQLAVYGGRIEPVKALVHAGAGVRGGLVCAMPPVQIAAMAGAADIVKFLISRGADINSVCGITTYKGNWRQVTTLNIARRRAHTEVVQLLEAAGAHSFSWDTSKTDFIKPPNSNPEVVVTSPPGDEVHSDLEEEVHSYPEGEGLIYAGSELSVEPVNIIGERQKSMPQGRHHGNKLTSWLRSRGVRARKPQNDET
ncbi:ankyrin 2,3/unc44 [Pochonia chlamydosporia 170]|uniref:Ankyrin 2,3/unc44 n=1 Tax=Pochonia chlamydosporia 170 TaxID=1380566 RepID=A0A179F1R9_METCM|nr:ankyrin 2,3/unc44 [Pochonia chlamydosporia 170]OAQ59397.1 ankyrin 2,3/unc44 [Pochonia chlamydosporia 170]